MLPAAWREGRVAWAEHLAATGTIAALRSAAACTPGDGARWRELGAAQLRANEPADDPGAAASLERAVSLNSYDAESRAALGLIAESQGRAPEAERDLLAAVRTSRRFRPQLALASFYFRAQDAGRFWPVASTAANIPAADPDPIFQMAVRMESDPQRAAALLRLDEVPKLALFVRFLAQNRCDAGLAPLALHLNPRLSHATLLAASNCLVDARRTADAVAVWNRLYPTHALDPVHGKSLTDARLELPERGAFHWKLSGAEGVDLSPIAPRGLRVEFSGRQPETVVLIEQFVPVLENRHYRLTLDYRTADLSGPTGIRWFACAMNETTCVSSQPLPGNPDEPFEFDFPTGPRVELVHLVLLCRRDAGNTRGAGTLTLRAVGLDLL